RFRILVMGRANAGKTTILQRVCNATDQPEIFNEKGEKVGVMFSHQLMQRGHHNIEDELVFKSNAHFVFHDSCGFEAGSEAEFDKMKKFVTGQAKTTKLERRIHAIWYCIPLNERHRMVTAAERKFFNECDSGHVPVIVLLTKADALNLDAIEELMERGYTEEDAMTEAPGVEKELQKSSLEKVKGWLNELKFPPQSYLVLTGMQQESAGCEEILKSTANALTEEGLQWLLISSQQSNLGLCMEFAIMK
ncbi:GTP-binding protein, partial [Pisolithus tinctorius]